MHQTVAQAVHCINPDCPRPYPQPWGNKFCNGCGATLLLNNRYIPVQRLGSGGFATIYTVWDLQKQTEQVLKVLIEPSSKAFELFEQESAVLEHLRHPGIPRVEKDSYFVLRLGNPQPRSLPCLVMEKISGQTLQDVLEQYPQGCPEELVGDWLYQAVDILGELHRNRIIHRDIKPSNLMLRQETGQLVAIDFGGAKQIGMMPFGSQPVSTRLISPGYSPPEQIMGEAVGPAADFYALGRTMIQLLTGQELENLHDPVTGEFQWRDAVGGSSPGVTGLKGGDPLVAVSPTLADLLDDMVRIDPKERPANADEIQQRLVRNAPISRKFTPVPTATTSFPTVKNFPSSRSTIALVIDRALEALEGAIALLGYGVTGIVRFTFRFITSIVLACLDTTWEMTLGTIGAAAGVIAGFIMIHWTSIGDQFASWLSLQLPLILPEVQITQWRELLIFGVAGIGTAWGLTLGGGFGQERRPLVAGVMGLLGYSIGWFIWQTSVTAGPSAERLLGLVTSVTVFLLVLGLGLPSHYLVHALVSAVGTGTVFGGLVWLKLLPWNVLVNIFSHSEASWPSFIDTLAFFCLLGVTLGFWLGVSYYLIVTALRWLGWR